MALSVFTALDERGAIKQLPRNVYDNTDYVPSGRLEDGDMRVLLSKLAKIGDEVAHTKSGILRYKPTLQYTVMTHFKSNFGRRLNYLNEFSCCKIYVWGNLAKYSGRGQVVSKYFCCKRRIGSGPLGSCRVGSSPIQFFL